MDNPAHPIGDVRGRVATFDVAPTARAGRPAQPAARRDPNGTDRVVGVLALAHDRPIDGVRPVLGSAAELAAVAVVGESG